jgi:hypothetical protein
MSARKPGAVPGSYWGYRAVLITVASIVLLTLAYGIAAGASDTWDRLQVMTQAVQNTWTGWGWSLF